MNLGLLGEVDDREIVGTIGDPVATGGTIAPVPVLPAVPAAVPVAKPVEAPETPVELLDASNGSRRKRFACGTHLTCAVFVHEHTLS